MKKYNIIMTKEEKELLLKDLCARAPYGVKVQYMNNMFDIDYVSPMYEEIKLDTSGNWTIGISEVKPYLFPLSSMSEEQQKEFGDQLIELELKAINDEIAHTQVTIFEVDFYNKNHFDYRGLIEKGLAIDATGSPIYSV